MVFVSRLEFREFRGVRLVKEPLELSDFTVLVGRNNSGKTTVLDALYLLPHPEARHPVGISALAERRGGRYDRAWLIRHVHSASPQHLIYRYSGRALIRYVLDRDIHLTISIGDGLKVFDNSKEVSASDVVEKLGLDSTENLVAYIPSTSEVVDWLCEALAEDVLWGLVEKSDAHVEVVQEVVNKALDEEYTEVLVRYRELYVRKVSGQKPYYVRIRDLGSGVEKTLSILLWLGAIKPKLVLWDDFEASMHPSLTKEVLRWLSRTGAQIVLATHSIDVLTRVLEVWPKNAQILLLKRTQDDVLLHKPLSLEELEDLLEGGQDPRLLPDLLSL